MIALNENRAISVKPEKTRLQNIVEDIQNGLLKIPVFQRDFVWRSAQMIELFDSIIKGYPIGSLLFWKPDTKFDTKDIIGPFRIESADKDLSYVLDGFQRITTLVGVLSNPTKMEVANEAELRNYRICFNLRDGGFTYLRKKKDFQPHLLPLYRLLDTFEFLDFLREIEMQIADKTESKQLIDNAKSLSKIFFDYEIPYVEIKGGDIASAVQIFSRVNSTGTEISEDFMLSALSYNQNTNFLFSEYITEFINSLSLFNFDNLKRDTILNCISNAKGKIYFDVKVEDLLSPDLEQLTHNSFVHIRKAVEFLNRRLFVLDARLLPYPTQLIFISEFFRINPEPPEESLKSLERWFWVTTYSNYFTLYSLSQQREAYRVFINFANDLNSDGILWSDEGFRTAKFPDKINFTGVRTKAIQLFMLNYTYKHRQVHPSDMIKESYIFNRYDRTPGNIIIRTTSDYDRSLLADNSGGFINELPGNDLSSYFFDAEMVEMFNSSMMQSLVQRREELIRHEESAFVRTLDIQYEEYIYSSESL